MNANILHGLHLQPRDLAILRELGEVGLLDTETIHARHFAQDQSGQACRRRLRLFAQHGFTQTIHLSVARVSRTGRLPMLHRLTPPGAELLWEEYGVVAPRPARADVPKPATLLHRLGMVQVQLAMLDACELARLPPPLWHQEYDLAPNPAHDTRLPQRFLLRREFARNNTKVMCWPDAACLLSIPHAEKVWKLAIFWEFDRSTESLRQVTEKIPGYELLLGTPAWKQLFPTADAARLFFVVPSRARLDNIAIVPRASPLASIVRLAVASDVTAHQVLAAPIWFTDAGEPRAIRAATPAPPIA